MTIWVPLFRLPIHCGSLHIYIYTHIPLSIYIYIYMCMYISIVGNSNLRQLPKNSMLKNTPELTELKVELRDLFIACRAAAILSALVGAWRFGLNRTCRLMAFCFLVSPCLGLGSFKHKAGCPEKGYGMRRQRPYMVC